MSFIRLVPLLLLIACIMTVDTQADITLAEVGNARAVIVAPYPVNALPAGATGIGTLSLSSARSGTLLHESFDGQSGVSIAPRGWQGGDGKFVIGSTGIITAKREHENQYGATADKMLPAPHRVTEEDPLTLQFILHLPAARREEAWTYVRLHTADGKRWSHGFAIGNDKEAIFALAAEPADPDRVPVPTDASSVLEFQMALGATRVTWSWRPHGSDAAWRSVASWGVAEPPTITGVRLVSYNHIDNSAGDHAAKRLVSATQDLALRLEQVTGVPFRTVTDDRVPADGPRIFVGDTPTIRALCPDVDFDQLDTDAILIRTVGNDLILSGGQPRGIIDIPDSRFALFLFHFLFFSLPRSPSRFDAN